MVGPWERFAASWMPPLPMSPALPAAGAPFLLGRILALVRGRLLGRDLTVRLRSGDLRLRLEDVAASLDPFMLTAGQADDVRAVASDVRWRGYRALRVSASLRNVHVRPRGVGVLTAGGGTSGASVPAIPPAAVLVAAPVDLVVTLDSAEVHRLVASRRSWLSTRIAPSGALLLRWARHPDRVALEVDAGADGRRLWIAPRALHGRRRRWDGPRRSPRIWITVLSAAPDTLHLLRLVPGPESLEVHLRIDEVRVPLSPAFERDLVERLTTATSLLDLSAWGLPGAGRKDDE